MESDFGNSDIESRVTLIVGGKRLRDTSGKILKRALQQIQEKVQGGKRGNPEESDEAVLTIVEPSG